MKKYGSHILLVISLMLGVFSYTQYRDKGEISSKYSNLKKAVIGRDSTLQVVKGRQKMFEKMVNDQYYSEQEIIDSLNIRLGETRSKLKSALSEISKEAEVRSVTQTDIVFVNKTDTLITYNNRPVRDYFYPSKEDYFIKHSFWRLSDTIEYSTWAFKKISLDLVVSEGKDGIWKTDAISNDFVEVKNIKVDMIPSQIVKIDNFDFLLGAGFSFNLDNFEVNTGIRVGRSNFLLGYSNQNRLKFNYIRRF